jgi:proline iminopeptidase
MQVKERRFKVSPIHELQIYEFGKPGGAPVIFFHGGPGSGINQSMFNLFDPNIHHVFFFDQRGCGKSTPTRCLEENTTLDLVADAEKIRQEYKIDKWFVAGGSWGSTLGLVYAGLHPAVVRGGVFWAITEYDPAELQKMCEIFPMFFPERWEAYQQQGGSSSTEKLIAFEASEMKSDSEERRKKAALRSSVLWSSGLTIDDSYTFDPNAFATVSEFFFTYALNGAFLTKDQRPSALGKNLAGKPITILHGRQDMRCLPQTAHKVHQSIPGSKLQFVAPAGHGSMDKNMMAALQKTFAEVIR